MIIQRGKRQYVAGMAWSMHSSLQEVKQHLKANASKPLARIEVARATFDDSKRTGGKQTMIGVYDGPKLKGKAFSLALAVGMVEHNSVVVEYIDEKTALVLIIGNGVPLPGRGERIIPRSEAINAIQEGLAFANSLIAPNDIDGVTRSLNDVLDIFEQKLESGQIKKKDAATITLVQPTSSLARVTMFTALAAIPAAAFLAYQVLQTNEAARLRERLNLDQIAQGKAAEANRQAALARAQQEFAQKVAQRRQELAEVHGVLEQQWQALEAVRKSLPLSAHGYAPQGVDCNRTQCTVRWVAAPGAFTRVIDKQRLPGLVEDNDQTAQATTRIDLPRVAGRPSVPTGLDDRALRMALADLLASAADSPVVEPLAPVTVAPPQGVNLPPAVAGATGRMRMNFTGATAIVRANDAMRQLARWPVMLRTAAWSNVNTGGATLTIEAEYTQIAPQ